MFQRSPASDAPRNTAGVVAPPPLIALAALAVGLGLDQLFPIGVVGALVPRTPRYILGFLFFVLGTWTALRAERTFHRHGTQAAPWRPTKALVTTGLFAKTRNPMYEGLGIVLFACVLLFASDWSLLCGIVAALVLHFGVVRREEHYLTRKFGDEYRAYMKRVPRYGWPF